MKGLRIAAAIVSAMVSGCSLYDGNNTRSRAAVALAALLNGPGSIINEDHVTTPFRDDFDGTAVDESAWQIATWVEESRTSRDRCYVADGRLNLVFIYEGEDAQGNDIFNGAAIQTRDEFLYGKWEASLKPTGVSGVLNSMYTIDWDNTSTDYSYSDGTKQEIDIEFLTKSFGSSSGQVHYAVHQSGRESFDTNPDVDLGFNPSDDFHTYAIEITPERIRWSVDGAMLREYVYAGNAIRINAPYQLKFNVWSQNGASTWVGGPPPVGTECVYQIDWISFTPYN
mgnify:CR=1 FL=1